MGENDEIKTVDAVVADGQPASQIQPVLFDENGRFAKGHQGNQIFPRQPSKRQQYLTAFQAAISFDDMTRMAKTMLGLAESGDTQAARIVCDYALGKPVQSVEVETNGTVSHGVLQVNFVRPDAT